MKRPGPVIAKRLAVHGVSMRDHTIANVVEDKMP